MQRDKIIFINNRYIEECIILPDGVRGYLDWITGTLRLNYTYDEWVRILKEENDFEEFHYWETLTHEMFHLLQICTTPYLYNYVTKIANIVPKAIEKLRQKQDADLDLVDYFMQYIAQSTTQHLIYEKNNLGISVFDLVEASAFLSHHRMLLNMDHEEYCSILSIYKDSEYEVTYSYLQNIINNRVFCCLPGIVFISLQYSKPLLVFEEICNKIKKYKSYVDDLNIENILRAIVKEIDFRSKGVSKLKSPWERMLKNPFYYSYLKKLSFISKANIESNMICPWTIKASFVQSLYCPILLNSGDMLVPESFENGLFKTNIKHHDFLKSVAIAWYYSSNIDEIGPKFLYSKMTP